MVKDFPIRTQQVQQEVHPLLRETLAALRKVGKTSLQISKEHILNQYDTSTYRANYDPSINRGLFSPRNLITEIELRETVNPIPDYRLKVSKICGEAAVRMFFGFIVVPTAAPRSLSLCFESTAREPKVSQRPVFAVSSRGDLQFRPYTHRPTTYDGSIKSYLSDRLERPTTKGTIADRGRNAAALAGIVVNAIGSALDPMPPQFHEDLSCIHAEWEALGQLHTADEVVAGAYWTRHTIPGLHQLAE